MPVRTSIVILAMLVIASSRAAAFVLALDTLPMSAFGGTAEITLTCAATLNVSLRYCNGLRSILAAHTH
jgi:hypothetical protein